MRSFEATSAHRPAACQVLHRTNERVDGGASHASRIVMTGTRVVVATLLVWVAALGAVWMIVVAPLPVSGAAGPREAMCLRHDGTRGRIEKARPSTVKEDSDSEIFHGAEGSMKKSRCTFVPVFSSGRREHVRWAMRNAGVIHRLRAGCNGDTKTILLGGQAIGTRCYGAVDVRDCDLEAIACGLSVV